MNNDEPTSRFSSAASSSSNTARTTMATTTTVPSPISIPTRRSRQQRIPSTSITSNTEPHSYNDSSTPTSSSFKSGGHPLVPQQQRSSINNNHDNNTNDNNSRWNDLKYRDPVERAQHKAEPSSWGVLHAAILIASSSNSSPSPSTTSGTPHPDQQADRCGQSTSASNDARSRARSRLRNKGSRSSLLSSGGKRAASADRSTAPAEQTLTEEPESYTQQDRSIRQERISSTPTCSPLTKSHIVNTRIERAQEEADSDSEDDRDDQDSKKFVESESASKRPLSSFSHLYSRFFPLSTTSKNVIKCVLAYFLAELFTFVPFLTDALGSPWEIDGPVRNAHVVATVAVYFYPARTIGSMFEADCFMLIGALYASFLCCGSMAMSVGFDRIGKENWGHAIVLLFWLGGGYGLLAYFKTIVNKPSFTTACSMVSLICSVIITKEGAFHIGQFQSQAILQVLIIVGCGSIISNLICFVLWPMSATSKLQTDLNKTLSSFATLLEMLTQTFLLEADITIRRPSDLSRAIDQHQSSFTTLKSSLSQAKFESFDARMNATTTSYDELVKIMTRLAQGLMGMRAGCALQYDLIRAENEGVVDFGKEATKDGREESQEAKRLKEDLVVLEKFKERVGPSLQTLSSISRATLSLLRTSFVQTKAGSATRQALRFDDPEAALLLTTSDLNMLKEELDSALLIFKREHSRAIKILYRSLPAQTIYGGGDLEHQRLAEDPFRDPGIDDAGPNESLFRVYHFCFNFEEWASSLSQLIEIFVEIRTTEEIVERKAVERRKRWGPLALLATLFGRVDRGQNGRSFLRGRRRGTREKRRSLVSRLSRWWFSSDSGNGPFPVIVDGALSSHQFPSSQLTKLGAIKQRIWVLGYQLKQPSARFAIKTGLGAAVLASVAFFPKTRPIWLEWRGEWALISYMVIMSPVIGGTNFLAFGRLVGTVAGGLIAVVCYVSFPENAVMLSLLGALVSVPCFYVIVTRPQLGPSSRFVLLTFNLTCLYSYNLREVDTHPASIAFHRTVAVSFGVVYGLIVNTYVWPFEARRELRKGLSEFFLNSAYLYERLVRTYSVPPKALAQASQLGYQHSESEHIVDERTSLLSSEAQKQLDENENEFSSMGVHLQLSLIKLQGLLSATVHEPRLKGPFPITPYRTILSACQQMLDLLTSIQQVTNREAWFTSVRRDFVIPVNRERREMVGNVLLYLSLLASALTLKTPLPAYLPPAAEARENLVKKLRSLKVVQKRIVRGGSEGLLYLGYALMMKDVIAQLDLLGATFQSLFGIIGGAESTNEFEALFIDQRDGGTLNTGSPPESDESDDE